MYMSWMETYYVKSPKPTMFYSTIQINTPHYFYIISVFTWQFNFESVNFFVITQNKIF